MYFVELASRRFDENMIGSGFWVLILLSIFLQQVSLFVMGKGNLTELSGFIQKEICSNPVISIIEKHCARIYFCLLEV